MATKVTGTNRTIRDAVGHGFWLLLVLSAPLLPASYFWLSHQAPWTLLVIALLGFLYLASRLIRRQGSQRARLLG
jgi:hypothetical protein